MEYNLDYKQIGLRIKNKRLKMKLTHEALSESVGVGVQHLSKIENGKAPLSLTCLVALANTLKTTTDHLLMDNLTEARPNLLGEVKRQRIEIVSHCIANNKDYAKTFRAFMDSFFLRHKQNYQTPRTPSKYGRTIAHIKCDTAMSEIHTQDVTTIHSDMLLAGISQMIRVILADCIHKRELLRSIKRLIC